MTPPQLVPSPSRKMPPPLRQTAPPKSPPKPTAQPVPTTTPTWLFQQPAIQTSNWANHIKLPPARRCFRQISLLKRQHLGECLQGFGMPTQAAGDAHSPHSPHAWALMFRSSPRTCPKSNTSKSRSSFAAASWSAVHSFGRSRLCPNIGKRRTARTP